MFHISFCPNLIQAVPGYSDTYSLTQVQEVDGSLLVGSVALNGAWNVDISPVNRLNTGKEIVKHIVSTRERIWHFSE